jgi:predicted deacylase
MITRTARAGLVALLALTTFVAVPAPAEAANPVIGTRLLGFSVQHRKIWAYHVGNPSLRPVSVLIGQMHGDEHAGVVVVRSIINGTTRVQGVNLWVVPTMNPDGDAMHTRQNAHHVDLNRNWPYDWAPLKGQYYSGTKPLSEPETRAVHRFLLDLRPRYVVSLHQPLYGVDMHAGSGPAYRSFRAALARNLGLPVKDFLCWSVCHGSMSRWYQAHRIGVAVETVEFGWHPTRAYLTGRARRGIIAALGGHI